MPEPAKPKKKRGGSSNEKKGSSPGGSRGDSPATPSKKSLMHEWRDAGPEVRVTLITGNLGASAAAQVRFHCREDSVKITLPDGLQWNTKLYATVLPDGSEYQYKSGKLLLRLLKLDPNVKWPCLEPIKIPRVKAPLPTKQMKDKTNAAKNREKTTVTSDSPVTPQVTVTNGVCEKPPAAPPPPSFPTDQGQGQPRSDSSVSSTQRRSNTSATVQSESSSISGTVQTSQLKSDSTSDGGQPGSSSTVGVSGQVRSTPAVTRRAFTLPAEPVTLETVKNSYTETDWEIRVYMYVKQIKNETLTVNYEPDRVTIIFGTRDERFLTSHNTPDPDTVFRWSVVLKHSIDPQVCTHSLTGSTLEIRLKKKRPQMWNGLHRPDTLPVPSVPRPMEPIPLHDRDSSGERGDVAAGGDASQPAEQLSNKPGRAASPALGASSSVAIPLPAPSGTSSGTSVSPSQRGLTGLDNIGNTCFLNSVIQCLANTRELRDYFSDAGFQSDINVDNPLGMSGKLALSFAVLLRVLWSGQHRSHNPHQLKALVAKKAAQFTGFAQHDAQEFMAFLLDGLHEDLNRVRQKPYTEAVEAGDRPDSEVASESWNRYRLRNDSIIVDLFQGQYKSKLVCPDCHKVSVTFDPFLYLSVPLPKKKRPISVTFFLADPTVRPVTYELYVTADGTADEIMEKLAERTGVSAKFIKIIEERNHKVLKVYGRGTSTSSVGRISNLLAFELLDPAVVGEEVAEITVIQRLLCPSPPRVCSYCRKEPEPGAESLRRCTRCYRTAYCDSTCQRDHWAVHRDTCRPTPEPAGCPFVVSVPKSVATYSNLCRIMESYSRYSVNVFCVPVTAAVERRDSAGSTASSDSGKCTDTEEQPVEKGSQEGETGGHAQLPQQQQQASQVSPAKHQLALGEDDNQLFFIKPVNQQGLSITTPDGARLKDLGGTTPLDLTDTPLVAMDWKTHRRSRPCCLVENRPLDSAPDPQPAREPSGPITLHQCLQLFTEPEQLTPDEAWYCPRCKAHKEAEKMMNLWRAPLNLIVQLKRFSFKDFLCRDKIDKLVDFPVRGLDLSPYLTVQPSDGGAIYDLYGVINHHGSILGGHYTAFARCVDPLNPEQSEYDWRLFDDSHVTYVSAEEKVVTEEAYLLFYRRRVPYQTPDRSTDAEELD